MVRKKTQMGEIELLSRSSCSGKTRILSGETDIRENIFTLDLALVDNGLEGVISSFLDGLTKMQDAEQRTGVQ